MGAGGALAHQKHHHAEEPKAQESPDSKAQRLLQQVNEAYRTSVRPVFVKSCFDCHSNQTRYPWYAGLPGAKQLIQSDVAEAKEHLDMSGDFPFKGHGTPTDDLEAIRDTVRDSSMPPARYWLLHWSSRLSTTEKQAVLEWVDRGLTLLQGKEP